MEPGKPMKGICSICNRLFIGESKPGERVDDVLLRMQADFDAHDCHEQTQQMVARIVKEARDHK